MSYFNAFTKLFVAISILYFPLFISCPGVGMDYLGTDSEESSNRSSMSISSSSSSSRGVKTEERTLPFSREPNIQSKKIRMRANTQNAFRRPSQVPKIGLNLSKTEIQDTNIIINPRSDTLAKESNPSSPDLPFITTHKYKRRQSADAQEGTSKIEVKLNPEGLKRSSTISTTGSHQASPKQLLQPSPRQSLQASPRLLSQALLSSPQGSPRQLSQPSPRQSSQPSPRQSPQGSPRQSPQEKPQRNRSLSSSIFNVFTPRGKYIIVEYINDHIEECFCKMGDVDTTLKSPEPFDLLRLKFYREVTKGTTKTKPQMNVKLINIYDTSLHVIKSTEELLKEFWKYPVEEVVNNPIYLEEIKQNIVNLERIAWSCLFLINEVEGINKAKDCSSILITLPENLINHIKTLSELLNTCFHNIPKENSDNKKYSYYFYKYFTKEGAYEKAWPHFLQCNQLLREDEEELKWLKLLKNAYLMEAHKILDPLTKANRYFEIGEITRKIDTIGSSLRESESCDTSISEIDLSEGSERKIRKINISPEATLHYLESAKYFYHTTSASPFEQIRTWDSNIFFPLACIAYCGAKAEIEDNKKRLLSISRDCFKHLIETDIISNYDCRSIVNELFQSASSTASDSKPIMPLRASIFASMGKFAWITGDSDKKNKSKTLCFHAAKTFYYLGFSKEKYAGWDSDLLDCVVNSAIPSAPQDPDQSIYDRMIKDLCEILAYRNYNAEVYPLAIEHFKKKEM